MKEYDWYVRIELHSYNEASIAVVEDVYNCTEERIDELVSNLIQNLENTGFRVETATILNVTPIF